MEVIKDTCYRGTRILLGNEKRDTVNKLIAKLVAEGFAIGLDRLISLTNP